MIEYQLSPVVRACALTYGENRPMLKISPTGTGSRISLSNTPEIERFKPLVMGIVQLNENGIGTQFIPESLGKYEPAKFPKINAFLEFLIEEESDWHMLQGLFIDNLPDRYDAYSIRPSLNELGKVEVYSFRENKIISVIPASETVVQGPLDIMKLKHRSSLAQKWIEKKIVYEQQLKNEYKRKSENPEINASLRAIDFKFENKDYILCLQGHFR